MKSKEEVINDAMHEFNVTVRMWLKTRLNGAWDNGYRHGRQDALNEIFATSESEEEEEN